MKEATTRAAKGLLLIITAPSGAGKTSLVKALVSADANIAVSVSHTTRPRRSTERDGVNYHFVPPDRFAQMEAQGDFLEHALVFGHHYGTSAKAVADKRAAGRDIILEIDWQGADQVQRKARDAIRIFVLPPSKQALKTRLTNRGENSPESIAKRLDEARLEMSHFKDFDYLVVNENFAAALSDLQAITRAERRKTSFRAPRERHLIQDLLS